jgi:hypothetical protein
MLVHCIVAQFIVDMHCTVLLVMYVICSLLNFLFYSNNCPIFRASFRALLQIRALQKSTAVPQGAILPPEVTNELGPQQVSHVYYYYFCCTTCTKQVTCSTRSCRLKGERIQHHKF